MIHSRRSRRAFNTQMRGGNYVLLALCVFTNPSLVRQHFRERTSKLPFRNIHPPKPPPPPAIGIIQPRLNSLSEGWNINEVLERTRGKREHEDSSSNEIESGKPFFAPETTLIMSRSIHSGCDRSQGCSVGGVMTG
ncbi:hypothetical protein DMENIID0001_005460 [Sergentomyia squamirostris]